MFVIRRGVIKALGVIAHFSLPTQVTVFLHRIRGVKIGKGSRIHRFVYIDDYCPEKITIGNHVGLGVGSMIIAHERDFDNERLDTKYKDIKITEKEVIINDFAYIGAGAIILPGVSIGKGAIIGSGAVVRNDIPEYSVAVGVPAKIIKFRKNEDLD